MATLMKPPPEVRSRAQRLARLLLMVLLILGAMLVTEHWRGKWALHAWQQKMIAKGEVFEPVALWPKPNPQNLLFSNRLVQATMKVPKEIEAFGGGISGIVLDESFQARRGSQEPRPQISGIEHR